MSNGQWAINEQGGNSLFYHCTVVLDAHTATDTRAATSDDKFRAIFTYDFESCRWKKYKIDTGQLTLKSNGERKLINA